MTDSISKEPQSPNSFLALGKSGKGAWWRYLLGVVIIIGGYMVLGTIAFILVLQIASGGRLPKMDPTGHASGLDPMANYVALNIGFLFIILFSWLVVRFLHGRSFRSLITPAKLNLKRVGIGFALWFCVVSIVSLVGSIIFPHDYKYALQSPDFFLFAPVVLLFTPMQCFAEELLFRGYLLQFLGKLTNSRWWLCGISAVIFAAPHFANPEVAAGDPIPIMLCYFTIGFFLTLATLRSNSLEIAIGIHIANNLFDGLIVNYSVSVLETRSIFLCTQFHPWYEFLMTVTVASLIYVVADRRARSAREAVPAVG